MIRALVAGLLLPSSRGEQPLKIDPTDHQIFADKLTSVLYTNANECTSALGVSMAFSLIYPGCTGEAIDQLRNTLGYPQGSNARLVWEDTTQSMLGDSAGQCLREGWGDDEECTSAAPLLKIANSVWFDNDSTLDSDYENAVGVYGRQIDFEADDSPIIVNEWVKNSTNGMINSIVDEGQPLFPPYVLIAINSIYLKARWAEQFKEFKTNLDSFYESASSATEVSQAHFMNMVDYFKYSHEALPGYQVIDLPFKKSQMSMIFVLPMSDSVERVSSTDLIAALGEMKSTRVALSLPKFRFESQYDDSLKESLMKTGITDPFIGGTGALCSMFENTEGCDKLIIDKIVQKTVIDVNEKGVEAAAVTAAMVVPTSIGPTDENAPVLMTLDHPFQFFIYDKKRDLMLFEGRLGEPAIPEREPAMPLLDSKHSDSDFWSNSFGVNPEEPPSSGNVANRLCFSSCACIFFTIALGFGW